VGGSARGVLRSAVCSVRAWWLWEKFSPASMGQCSHVGGVLVGGLLSLTVAAFSSL